MDNIPSKSPRSLLERAQQLVATQPYFRGASYPITFQTFENVLVVSGRVPSFYLKQILQRELAQLDGVKRLENHVEVDYQRFGS
jgi:hypothetical protein